ncbi:MULTISPECIES: YHS domain-containing protein [Bacillaceae]|uniref:YHS domain-containing protein n=1 Tax=Bacillaceae TaxID=186817 RepID=UPI0003683A5D|nr:MULTISPECIES: YHS domain-containing protein [Bacillaceae]
MNKCDVCGFESNAKNHQLTATYNGKTYTFCCPMCEATFKTLPKQFESAHE